MRRDVRHHAHMTTIQGSDYWRTLQAPPLEIPDTRSAWRQRRQELRDGLARLFGALPPRPGAPRVTVLERRTLRGFVHERLTIDNGAGASIPAHLLLPEGTGPFPAVLYHHCHGGWYHQGKAEVLQTSAERPGVIGHPDGHGPDLARNGYAVLCIDAYCFGERAGQGPAADELDGQGEQSTFKAFLWAGWSMWGMMVRDDRIALDVLSARPEVDASRIAATGFSMGSTRSFWLAALDDRVRTVVGVGCLTRYQDIIGTQALRAHGIYFFVPGMLSLTDIEGVIALIAPRPCLFQTGDQDMGSPLAGMHRIAEDVQQVYDLLGAPEAFRSDILAGLGHDYTPDMWRTTRAWIDAGLGRRPSS